MELTFLVLAHFIDHAVQRAAHPSDSAELLGIIGSAVYDVLSVKEHLHFLKPETTLRVRPEQCALREIERETHV